MTQDGALTVFVSARGPPLLHHEENFSEHWLVESSETYNLNIPRELLLSLMCFILFSENFTHEYIAFCYIHL